tara:strand:- start:690 stop:1139 length:450 start_codon:yes stop_codon:yes gene_type:complete
VVATYSEGINLVIDILNENWNRGNTSGIKPVVMDVADVSPERGKRLDMRNKDYVIVFETAHNEETPELLYDFVTTRINITLDARTMRSRKQQQLMENEIRRIVHLKRKGDGSNMDRIVYKTRTDLSDRTKFLFRTTFQVEVVIFAELIP